MNTKLAYVALAIVAAAAIAAGARWALDSDDIERPGPSPAEPVARSADGPETDALPGDAGRAAATPGGVPLPADATPVTAAELGLEAGALDGCRPMRFSVRLPDGSQREAVVCARPDSGPDTYAGYSNAALEVLAYADAHAAATLGRRYADTDRERSRAYSLRAVALDPDDLAPLSFLRVHLYSLRGDSDAARTAIAQTYVLTQVARALGSNASIDWVLRDITEAGFSNREIAYLDRWVDHDLDYIRNVQVEVYGTATAAEGES